MRETRFDPWVGKITWRRKWQPTLVLWKIPWRSLVGYSPQGHKKSDMTQRIHFTFTTFLLSPSSHLLGSHSPAQLLKAPRHSWGVSPDRERVARAGGAAPHRTPRQTAWCAVLDSPELISSWKTVTCANVQTHTTLSKCRARSGTTVTATWGSPRTVRSLQGRQAHTLFLHVSNPE